MFNVLTFAEKSGLSMIPDTNAVLQPRLVHVSTHSIKSLAITNGPIFTMLSVPACNIAMSGLSFEGPGSNGLCRQVSLQEISSYFLYVGLFSKE